MITASATIKVWVIASAAPNYEGKAGVVQQQQRLGGLLNYYDRAAA